MEHSQGLPRSKHPAPYASLASTHPTCMAGKPCVWRKRDASHARFLSHDNLDEIEPVEKIEKVELFSTQVSCSDRFELRLAHSIVCYESLFRRGRILARLENAMRTKQAGCFVLATYCRIDLLDIYLNRTRRATSHSKAQQINSGVVIPFQDFRRFWLVYADS